MQLREIICLTFSCSLIVASRFHPTPLLLSLLDFVAPSRPFVVYCQYKEVILKWNGLQFLYLNIAALKIIINRTLFMPLASVGVLHKTSGKRRGHQPQAVWNLAQKLPGMYVFLQPVPGSYSPGLPALHNSAESWGSPCSHLQGWESLMSVTQSALTFPDPFFFFFYHVMVSNSSPETLKMQTTVLMFPQGFESTVEWITDNGKIPQLTRRWPFPLCWDVFAASVQDFLVESVSSGSLKGRRVRNLLEKHLWNIKREGAGLGRERCQIIMQVWSLWQELEDEGGGRACMWLRERMIGTPEQRLPTKGVQYRTVVVPMLSCQLGITHRLHRCDSNAHILKEQQLEAFCGFTSQPVPS